MSGLVTHNLLENVGKGVMDLVGGVVVSFEGKEIADERDTQFFVEFAAAFIAGAGIVVVHDCLAWACVVYTDTHE